MSRSQNFTVFTGSSIPIRWITSDESKKVIEAYSVGASILSKTDESEIAVLTVERETVGMYKTTIDTTALGLAKGTYVIEFRAVVNGFNRTQRDFLNVRFTF